MSVKVLSGCHARHSSFYHLGAQRAKVADSDQKKTGKAPKSLYAAFVPACVLPPPLGVPTRLAIATNAYTVPNLAPKSA